MKALKNIYTPLFSVYFIAFFPNAFGDDVKKVDYREIGDKAIIIGMFGEMGLSHQFKAIHVRDEKKIRGSGPSVKLTEVDGKPLDHEHVVTIAGLAEEQAGTIIKFEAQEMGELVKLGLGGNPRRRQLDRVGCRSVLILKDASVMKVGFDDSTNKATREVKKDGGDDPFK